MKNKNTKNSSQWFPRLLAGERSSVITVPAMSIIISFVFVAAILLIIKQNPITALKSILQGCGILPKAKYGNGRGILTDLFIFINNLAPMILAGLAFVVGLKAGLFNIGISGQMLLAGFTATVIVGYSDLSAAVAKPLVIVIGIVVGALVGVIIGFLKYKFNIHEVVSTILLNYIINYTTSFFINGTFVDPLTRTMKACNANSRLAFTGVEIGGVKCDISLGIVIAIICVFIVKFIYDKTVLGFELKAVGSNIKCSKYAGIKTGNRILLSMIISGALAGLAGVTLYLGYTNIIVPRILSSIGYDSISAAMLGGGGPVGVIFGATLITIFQAGANYMSSQLGVAKEIASLITGILLLFSACGGYIKYRASSYLSKNTVRLDDKIKEDK